ncbi:MAG: J domain-containing protein [Acidobacteria bacterium]|nr:J domain-containing protein [Acidobacteriota bacterium]
MWNRPPKNFYDVLGVPPTASAEEIRSAFLALAKQFHPDLARDARSRKQSTRKMQELNEAYAVLGHADKRADYDASLSTPPRPETPPPPPPRRPWQPPVPPPPEREIEPATYGFLLKFFLLFPALIVVLGILGFSGIDLFVLTVLWFLGFHCFQQYQDPRPKR